MHGGPGDVDERVRQRQPARIRRASTGVSRANPGAAGIHFAAYVIRELAPGRYVHDTPETGSKVTRMKPVSGQAKIGNFKIVRHPGCEITRSQLIDFPYAISTSPMPSAVRSRPMCMRPRRARITADSAAAPTTWFRRHRRRANRP